MGCVGVVSQRGQSMTGSRSVSALTRSKDRLPVPITRDAPNSTVSTPESRRIVPTSWRLRRCGDSLELPDKTIGVMANQDDTGGQLDPAEVALRGPVEASRDPAELGQERMAALDRATDAADPRAARLAALGGLHPEARRRRPLLAGA